jgi:hypothetical protein
MRGKEMVLLDRRDNCRANAKRALQTGLDRRSEVRLDSPDQSRVGQDSSFPFAPHPSFVHLQGNDEIMIAKPGSRDLPA